MSVLFGASGSSGGCLYNFPNHSQFDDDGCNIFLPGLGATKQFWLAYWYKQSSAEVTSPQTVFAARSYNSDLPILIVNHLPNGQLQVVLGDGNGGGVFVRSNTGAIPYDGQWHHIVMAVNLGGTFYANMPYGDPLCVLLDMDNKITPFNVLGSTGVPFGPTTWKGTSFWIGSDPFYPAGFQPLRGLLQDVFFTTKPYFLDPIDGVSTAYVVANTALRQTALGYLLVKVETTFNMSFGTTLTLPVLCRGSIGFEGENLLPATLPGDALYPSAGKFDPPYQYGTPAIFLTDGGPRGNAVSTWAANHKWGQIKLAFDGSSIGADSAFIRYGGGGPVDYVNGTGIVAVSGDDPFYVPIL